MITFEHNRFREMLNNIIILVVAMPFYKLKLNTFL